MAKSQATSIEEYMAELPEERRAVLAELRELIWKNLPDGYTESLNWGMITYEIPLERYPDTYNGQPLSYLALAAQKSDYALYLTSVYMNPEQEAWLRDEFKKAGKKADLGKSCLRFRKLQDLHLDAVARVISSTSPGAYIELYEATRRR